MSLVVSVVLFMGQYGVYRNGYRSCLDMTPDSIYFAAKVPESVEVGVEMSLWPLSPICHWQAENVKASQPLLDWGYTYFFYGGLLVAFLAASTLTTAAILFALRQRRAESN